MLFTNPWMLIGLVAIGIPVAVHLFNFRRYKKVYFSNVESLEALQKETRKQSRLRELLVLLARIAAVVFLVLAFAGPVIPSRKSQHINQGVQWVSVYLDNSFSMGNTSQDGLLLEIGKQKAKEILDGYGISDQFQLITNECSGGQYRWMNRSEMMLAIDAVDLCPAAEPLSRMVERQQNFIRQTARGEAHCYEISDMQTGTADLSDLSMDSLCEVTLVPLEGVEIGNLYVDTLELNAPCYHKGNTLVAKVGIRNEGEADAEALPVNLYVNGRERAIASVDIPAGDRKTVEMSFVADEEGVLSGMVEIVDYPITFDDRYYFSINVADRNSLLLVNGGDANPHLLNLFASDSNIALQSVSADGADFSSLGQYDMVILNELKSLPGGRAEEVARFVEAGGTLLLIPADGLGVEDCNLLLQRVNAPRLGKWIPASATAKEIVTDNALYENVFKTSGDRSSQHLEMPEVKGHYATTLTAPGTTKMPLITLADGNDYLMVSTFGSGRCYLFTAPLRQPYTNFPQQAMFVPTLYNMALFSRPTGRPAWFLGDRTPIPLPQEFGNSKEVPHLVNLAGNIDLIPELRRTQQGPTTEIPNTLQEAGNYLLTLQPAHNTRAATCGLSFNYGREESKMKFHKASDLKKTIREMNLGGIDVVEHSGKDMATYIKAQNQGTKLWRVCLVGALLMLLCETLLLRKKQPRN